MAAVGWRVLGIWERALEAIAAGDLDAIAQEIDWVIKYQLIERYRAAHDLSLTAPQVALSYHDIGGRSGLDGRSEWIRGRVANYVWVFCLVKRGLWRTGIFRWTGIRLPFCP